MSIDHDPGTLLYALQNKPRYDQPFGSAKMMAREPGLKTAELSLQHSYVKNRYPTYLLISSAIRVTKCTNTLPRLAK